MRALEALAAGALAAALSAAPGCGSREDLVGVGGAGGGAAAQGSGAGAAQGTAASQGADAGATAGATSGAGPASGSGTGAGPGSTGAGPGSTGAGASGSVGSTSSGPATCAGFGDACTDCLSTGCPDVWCGCDENPACLQLFGCLGDCNDDPACAQSCFTQVPDGISDVYLVSDCAATACPADCGWGTDLPPCTECLLTECDDAMNTCLAEPECLLLYDCLTGCPPVDLACQQGCYDAHGAGVASLQAVLECSTGVCADPCVQ